MLNLEIRVKKMYMENRLVLTKCENEWIQNRNLCGWKHDEDASKQLTIQLKYAIKHGYESAI